MTNKSHVLAFDFDAVISTYERPWKFDEPGEPVKEIVDTIRYYFEKGYYILILTGRHSTPKIVEWLKVHNIPYDGFNVNPKPYINASRFKPYYDVIIDDKALNFDYQHNRKSSEQLIKEIDKIIELGDSGKAPKINKFEKIKNLLSKKFKEIESKMLIEAPDFPDVSELTNEIFNELEE